MTGCSCYFNFPIDVIEIKNKINNSCSLTQYYGVQEIIDRRPFFVWSGLEKQFQAYLNKLFNRQIKEQEHMVHVQRTHFCQSDYIYFKIYQ